MKRNLLLSFLLVGVGLVPVAAQQQPQRDVEKERRVAQEEAFNTRVDALRNSGKDVIIRDRYRKDRIFIDVIRPLYRDLHEDEKPLLAPDSELVEKYSGFVDGKKSGLIKLLADRGCDGGAETVSAEPHCEKYRMPGSGASYSFRTRRYSMKRLADLTYGEGQFDTAGLVKHGILVNIGDVPLEKVGLDSPPLATLVTFEPIKDYEMAEKFSGILAQGVPAGKLTFGSSLKVEKNRTYALRSIAYRTNIYRQVQDTVYDEFDFDERDDVIVVFRVVRHEPGESVTLLWKELKTEKAPQMIVPAKD